MKVNEIPDKYRIELQNAMFNIEDDDDRAVFCWQFANNYASQFKSEPGEREQDEIVRVFKELAEKQQDIPPDIQKAINERFWELL
jgi:hypothetical protein